MPDRNALIGFAVFAVALAACLWLFVRNLSGRRRTMQLRAAAAENGFEFLGLSDPLASTADFPVDRFPALQRRETIRNAMHCDFVYGAYYVFDVVPAGGGRRVTAALIRVELAVLPDFALAPLRMPQRNLLADGHEPAFFTTTVLAGTYRLLGRDGDALNNMFGGDICPRVAATPRCGRLSVQGSGRWIAMWEPQGTVDPSDLQAFVRDCEQLTAILASRRAGVRLRSKY